MTATHEPRASLVEYRKRVVAARENWRANIQAARRTDFIWLRRRRYIAFCKTEAADCLKYERACTQLIETIDGKRVAPGVLMGDKSGRLSYQIPKELESAFLLCRGIADYGSGQAHGGPDE